MYKWKIWSWTNPQRIQAFKGKEKKKTQLERNNKNQEIETKENFKNKGATSCVK